MRGRKLRQERGGPALRGWRRLKGLISIAGALAISRWRRP